MQTREELPGQETSPLHMERGMQSKTRNSMMTTESEGSLQVPIPCAVLAVVIIVTLIIAIISLSVGQYNCPGKYVRENISPMMTPMSLDLPVSSCPDSWIGYQGKCYIFSNTTGNWSTSKNACSSHDSTLAQIDSKEDLNFLRRYAGNAKHWIGLRNEVNQAWQWTNGKEFSGWFNLTGSGNCAYLRSTEVRSVKCREDLHWICSKPTKP
ncbi:early activation antigen CD69-like [Dromiciops gliroides]|uniref:early activation antigen CD69-like n=1 Tax=Dromiciops gliroides TaxID=33562 RepID=UPI001CC73559|nr:early activation antigen CD69-like [Dromiciops gliroides]